MTQVNEPGERADIVARAGTYYRNTRYVLAAMMFFFGLWFAKDGFISYPAQREQALQALARNETPAAKPRTETDILIQRVLGVALPPLSLIGLFWFLYRSRGEYRLSGSTLHVPGHPPIALDSIRELDLSAWDRKGIARFQYAPPKSETGVWVTLDDFIYDRQPTDLIVDQIKRLFPADESLAAPASENAESEKGDGEIIL